MSPAWRRHGRRARFAIGALLATLLISAAAAMALGQLLLPLLHAHPQKAAQLLSWRLHQPVSLSAVRGEWQPSGPLLIATDLRIGSGAQALSLPHAQLKVDFGAWLKRDTRWLELRITGLDANITRDLTGKWQLTGLSNQSQQTNPGTLTELPVGLLLRDVTLNIDDAKSQRRWQVHASLLRALNRGGSLRVAARVTPTVGVPPLTVVLRISDQQRSARVYVAGDDIDLGAWTQGFAWAGMYLDGGHARRLRVWLDWRGGQLDDASVDLALDNLRVSSPSRGSLQLAQWDGRMQAHRDGEGWLATYVDTRKARGSHVPAAGAKMAWQPRPGGSATMDVDADDLDITQLVPWLGLLPQVPTAWASWLKRAAPYGQIVHAHAHWLDGDQFEVQAQLSGVGFTSVAGIPGTSGLQGELRADAQAASLTLPAQATSVDDPRVFRQPFALQRIAGTLAAWHDSDGWQIGSEGLQMDGTGFAVTVSGSVAFAPDTSPLLDLAAVVNHADVPAAKQFWPVNVMPPAAVAWLDRALVAGQLSGGRAVIRGHLADWPFRDESGHFEALASIKDATLDYEPDWPRAEGVDAQARFVNTGMQVTASAARSLGNVLDSASADIADFDDATLELQLRGHGDRNRAMQFVRRSPLGKRFASALRGLTLIGRAAVDLHLALPLHDADEADTVLMGRAQLTQAVFAAPAWSLQLDQLSGAIDFNKGGLASDGLQGQFHAQPVTLDVKIGDAAVDPAHQLEASMQGRFDTASLVQGFDTLQWLDDIGQGAANFDIGVTIDSGTDIAASAPHLSVASDLRGMALMLPAPLDKPADTSMPLRLDVGMPFAGATLNLRLGDILAARLRLPDDTRALAADIALGGPVQALPDHGIIVQGHVPRLDLSGWIRQGLALAGSGSGDGLLHEVDVVAQQMSVFGRHFQNLALKLQAQPTQMSLSVAGEQVDGTIIVPASDLAQRGVTVKLQHLYWPADDSAQAAADDDTPGVAPASVPPLHLWVGDLRFGHAHLGETRFESYPIANGMHVEQLETHSPDVQISARGNWSGTAEANQTRMVIDFSSHDLGRMLDAFGYPGMVAGGTTLAHVDGTWSGSPSAFSLAEMDGNMKVHVAEGRILDVDPGVGRLFGLFSIRELPRRLSLDFGDLFQSGFSFNTIDGNFVFSHGNAHTDDLQIRGPAAAIAIRGRTDLSKHEYDQLIDVSPHVGAALPIVGAIAGGPLGAAAGLAVQSLLGRGLGKAAGARYHVTGSWDKPTITLLARERGPGGGKPAAAASVPAPVPPASAGSQVTAAPAAASSR